MQGVHSAFAGIDVRSFDNVWYWFAVAAFWTAAGSRALGIPFAMAGRARRRGGQEAADLDALAAIAARRAAGLARAAAVPAVALASCGLSMLAVLGFRYGSEFAQAAFLLAMPAALLGLLRMRLALRLERERLTGEALWRALSRHRAATQALGAVSILLAAFWGALRLALAPI